VRIIEPVLLKSLKLLRDTSESLTEKEIAERIKEDQVYVAKTLEKLRQRKVIAKNGEFYSYQKTAINEDFSQKMLAVYDKIIRKSKLGLVIIGLLSTVTQSKHFLRQNTLLRVLEEEGFDEERINNFLERELKAERIIKTKIAFISKNKTEVQLPPAIRFRYVFPHEARPEDYPILKPYATVAAIAIFKANNKLKRKEWLIPATNFDYDSHYGVEPDEYEKFKKRCLEEDSFIQEEDYLIADFPSNMTASAKEYLEKEVAHTRQKIKDEIFEYWYGSREDTEEENTATDKDDLA